MEIKEKTPVYDKREDAKPDVIDIPIQLIGIASKEINKNPFRKKGRKPYVLRKGALFIASKADFSKFKEYLDNMLNTTVNQFAAIPYTEETRKQYKKAWTMENNPATANLEAALLTHYWVHHGNGLRYSVMEYPNSELKVALMYGSDFNVDLQELLKMATKQLFIFNVKPNDFPKKETEKLDEVKS